MKKKTIIKVGGRVKLRKVWSISPLTRVKRSKKGKTLDRLRQKESLNEV